jgi:hypothetical protein
LLLYQNVSLKRSSHFRQVTISHVVTTLTKVGTVAIVLALTFSRFIFRNVSYYENVLESSVKMPSNLTVNSSFSILVSHLFFRSLYPFLAFVPFPHFNCISFPSLPYFSLLVLTIVSYCIPVSFTHHITSVCLKLCNGFMLILNISSYLLRCKFANGNYFYLLETRLPSERSLRGQSTNGHVLGHWETTGSRIVIDR